MTNNETTEFELCYHQSEFAYASPSLSCCEVHENSMKIYTRVQLELDLDIDKLGLVMSPVCYIHEYLLHRNASSEDNLVISKFEFSVYLCLFINIHEYTLLFMQIREK